ncbi:hypothetical protein [Spirosoma oryzae]|uniref:hypothetical protein n=1 Tax=Spirosoma oryzae TaxID=1469603 RepID=UPI0011B1D8F4|nr:hypothetical protein [Spirosoma oryzae]
MRRPWLLMSYRTPSLTAWSAWTTDNRCWRELARLPGRAPQDWATHQPAAERLVFIGGLVASAVYDRFRRPTTA